jgi:hypothetical protein
MDEGADQEIRVTTLKTTARKLGYELIPNTSRPSNEGEVTG